MVFFPLWEATCSDIWGNYPILIFLNKIFLYLFNSLSSPWPPSLNTCGHYCSLQSPNLPTATPDIWLWTHRANSFSTNVPMSSSFVIYMLGFFGFSRSPWLFTHIINGLVILLSFLPSLFYYKSLVRILLMLLFSYVQLFVTPWTAACQVSVLHFLPEFAQTRVHGVRNLLIEPFWGICLFVFQLKYSYFTMLY